MKIDINLSESQASEIATEVNKLLSELLYSDEWTSIDKFDYFMECLVKNKVTRDFCFKVIEKLYPEETTNENNP